AARGVPRLELIQACANRRDQPVVPPIVGRASAPGLKRPLRTCRIRHASDILRGHILVFETIGAVIIRGDIAREGVGIPFAGRGCHPAHWIAGMSEIVIPLHRLSVAGSKMPARARSVRVVVWIRKVAVGRRLATSGNKTEPLPIAKSHRLVARPEPEDLVMPEPFQPAVFLCE